MFKKYLKALIEWAISESNEFKFEKVSYEEWKKRRPDWITPVDWELSYLSIKLPKRATEESAGYDILAPFEFSLAPQEVVLIPTGLKASIGKRKAMLALPKSGLGFKFFVRLANTIGLIDSDYYNNIKNEGHIMIKMRNESLGQVMQINHGEAFCQVVVIKYEVTVDDKAQGVRVGGIGSTSAS